MFLVKMANGYQISPCDEGVKEALEVAWDIVKRYRNAFKELAK